jgi:hypothetical protein
MSLAVYPLSQALLDQSATQSALIVNAAPIQRATSASKGKSSSSSVKYRLNLVPHFYRISEAFS